MTLITVSTAPDMTSDASFRVWGKSICDTIISLGWVRASDTGNINWTTVTKPSAINTSAGWEIFCMGDSLQSTAPVYMKMEFGAGSATSNTMMWVTVGTGTNGSGTLTGQVGTRSQVLASSSPGTTLSYPCRYSGSSNRLAIILWFGANYAPTICIERTHDTSGGDTGVGIMFTSWQNQISGGQSTQYVPFSGTVPAPRTGTNHPNVAPTSGTGASGSDVYIWSHRIWGIGNETSPSLQFFYYYASDLTTGNVINAVLWDGSTHAIYPFGNLYGSAGCYGGSVAMAMRND